MPLHLAWYDLLHRRARTAAALGGVAFAIVLIFMQSGFYLACRASATRILDLLAFDVLITSARYTLVAEADRMPADRLAQARAAAGVEGVAEVRIGPGLWRTPTSTPGTRLRDRLLAFVRPVADLPNRYDTLLMGIDPEDRPFRLPPLNDQLGRLHSTDTVLFDRLAHPVLGDNVEGVRSEYQGHALDVVGTYAWGAGFAANGLAVTSVPTFARVFPERAHDELQLGLVTVAAGHDPATVAATLRQRLPKDVEVWTRAEVEARDRRFFLTERPIGLMFTSGVVLALLVGGIILFQVLASEVTSRRGELATLQAIGYTRGQVYQLVVARGVLYTLVAFVPAALLAVGLFRITRTLARLPMSLGPGLVTAVLAASLVMCLAGALLASRRVRSADPADLF